MTCIIEAISNQNSQQIACQTRTNDKKTMDTVRKQYSAQGYGMVRVRVEYE